MNTPGSHPMSHPLNYNEKLQAEVSYASPITLKNARKQFGKGILFEQDGKKETLTSKRLKIVIVFIFSVVTVLLCLKHAPEGRSSGGISTPEVSIPLPDRFAHENNIVEIPAFRSGTYVQMSEVNLRDKKGGIIKYSGPTVVKSMKDFKIPPGSIVQAKLISGASNGPVRAELIEDLLVNGSTLAPSGTILLGAGQSTEERLFIQFTKLIFRDGSFHSVSAMALDHEDQIAGLKGSKIGQYATKLAAGIGLNFVGGLAQGLQEHEVQGIVSVSKTNMRNALLNGAEKASLEEAGDLMSGLKGQTPIIEVKALTEIYVIFGDSQ